LAMFTAPAHYQENMVHFYQTFLSDNPTYHEKFTPVKDMSVYDIRNSEWLKSSQGFKFGQAVLDLVAKMDDGAKLEEYVSQLVAMKVHVDNNLQARDYQKALMALTKTIKKIEGKQFTNEHMFAWMKMTALMARVFDGATKRRDHANVTLTADDQSRIRANLSQFNGSNMGENMAHFYQTFFSDNGDYHEKFTSLKDIPIYDFKTNEWLRSSQGQKFGTAVVDFVGKINDPAGLQEAIRRLIKMPQHTQNNLGASDYQAALIALMKTHQKILGKNFSKEDDVAWRKMVCKMGGLFQAELAH